MYFRLLKRELEQVLVLSVTCVFLIEGIIYNDCWWRGHLKVEAVHGGDQVQGHGGHHPLGQYQPRGRGEVQEQDVQDQVRQEQAGTYHGQPYPWQQEVFLLETENEHRLIE